MPDETPDLPEIMRINIIVPEVKHGVHRFFEGEQPIEAELGRYFIENGWAEDPAGKIPTGKTGTGEIAPANVKSKGKVK